MSDLQTLFEDINDIEATIAEINRAAEGDAFSPATTLMVKSLEHRRSELRDMAEALAAERLVDICDYRILPSQLNRYPIKEVGQSLSRWQEALTSFFAAVRDKKPRARAIFSEEIERLSTLNFAFSYQGSLGVVMYVPNDQLLMSDTDLDIAVNAIMALVDTQTVSDVRQVADQFGKAAVKSFFDWSKVHTEADISADIKWQRGKEVKLERLVQPEDLERVQAIIKIADNREESIDSYVGVLVALNVKGSGSFKMSFPDPALPDVAGKFDPNFNWQMPHRVPATYRATLRRISLTSLWSNDERTEWELIELEELKSHGSSSRE
jgi:hypothetical protein